MVAKKEHRTLVGGALTSTQYVEGTTHVHIHFLEIGRTEICCHGCHSSTIYVHGKKNPAGMQEVLVKQAQQHEKCAIAGVDFEKWCPDIRFKTQVIDLTRASDAPSDTQRQ